MKYSTGRSQGVEPMQLKFLAPTLLGFLSSSCGASSAHAAEIAAEQSAGEQKHNYYRGG